MSDDVRLPIIEEEAWIAKRAVEIERVRVRSVPEEREAVVRETLRREGIEVTRMPVGREVDAVPAVRTEGDVTIVPVVEERLVVEKRLVLVEEVHLRRVARTEPVEASVTLRATRVEIVRETLQEEP